MDDATVQWSKQRYDECIAKLTPFLRGSGYNPKTDLEFMPISGYTGANLKEPVDKKVCAWYTGPSLLDYLDNMQMLERKIAGGLLIPITEKHRDMGTYVVGKIESGQVKVGQNVLIMPNKRAAEVAAIFLEEEEVQAAQCGDNVRLRLRGVEEEEISIGFVLCAAKHPVHTVIAFEAQLAILEHRNIITAGYNAVMHIHAATEEVTIAALLHAIDKKTNKKSKRPPPFVKKGQQVIARLELSAVVCAESFKDHPQLGRFTLRDEGKTIAIGKITKLIPME
jgi:peptide chain release factor subunit 3